MRVDYEWVQTLLDGSIEYTQYNAAGVVIDSTVDDRISYIDVRFKVGKTLAYPWLVVSGTGPFVFGLSPTGTFAESVSVDRASIANNGTVRIYIRASGAIGPDRVFGTLRLQPGGIGWQPPVWESPQFGYIQIQPEITMMTMRMNLDDSGFSTYNLRTGWVVVGVNNDRRNSTGTCSVRGETWKPGLRGYGWEDYYNYVSVGKSFPAAAIPGITGSSNFRAWLSSASGRGPIRITQVPSAANDYTLTVRANDPQDGDSGYAWTVNVEVT